MSENPPSVQLVQINLPVLDNSISISIRTGDAFMVAGPNGVGKSALLYEIYRTIGAGRAEYYAGHRQITFNNGWDNLGQDIDQLRTNLYTHVDVFNRYKNQWAEDVFKSIVRRLSNADSAYNAHIVSLLSANPANAQAFRAENPGPLNLLNQVFAASRMAVRFKSSGRGLRVTRSGIEYDIDQLSDGERAALFVSGAVIVQDPYTIVVIDEPERNLHPSIAAPLVNALILARPDIAFLFASHDMNLISSVSVDSILYVRDSQVVSTRPEMRVFDVKVLTGFDGIDEDLKRDLIGSRQDVLFIEGTTASIDFQIYNALFPDWKVSPKGGADNVVEAVKALSDNPDLHWFKLAGLIDRDGRSEEEVQKLALANVNTILCPTSENLLFLPEIIRIVAGIISLTEGGGDAESRILIVNSALKNAISQNKNEIVARISTWRANRLLAEQKVSVSQMRDGTAHINNIKADAVKESVQLEIESLIAGEVDLVSIQSLPIKNTGIPSSISSLVGCTYDRYKKIIFRQLELNNEAGQRIRATMLTKIPQLVSQNPA